MELLKGKPVADSLTERVSKTVRELKARGIAPALAIVRVGEEPGDMAYERGALKRAEKTGIDVRQVVLDRDVSQAELTEEIEKLNDDESVHGVLVFRPLPKHMDEKTVCDALDPRKDVDGITSGSMAGVFTDSDVGFPPCTAEACMEMLDYYNIGLEGRKLTVMGRSLVIGKPAAMMAMRRNATVTVCHSRTGTENMKAAGRNADIVIAAVGKARMITKEYLGTGQTVIDVGINTDEQGNMCGDVDFDGAAESAAAVTPVPGGVGSVTTAVLMAHTAEAADRQSDDIYMEELWSLRA